MGVASTLSFAILNWHTQVTSMEEVRAGQQHRCIVISVCLPPSSLILDSSLCPNHQGVPDLFASQEPPDISYQLHLPELVENGGLSGLQLESIVYACQHHEQLLPSGERCGFFLGDGQHSSPVRPISSHSPHETFIL